MGRLARHAREQYLQPRRGDLGLISPNGQFVIKQSAEPVLQRLQLSVEQLPVGRVLKEQRKFGLLGIREPSLSPSIQQ